MDKIILLFSVAGFIAYANTFQNKMFWDDNDFILNNAYIKDWGYFPKYFTENVIAGAGFLSNYWRPALLFVFSLEWHLWESWETGYHLVNASFHIANAILLFAILFYIFRKHVPAIFTALIFLLHPVQTEAVAYVNSLGDSLSVFFIFLGIIFYLKFRASQKTPLYSHFYFLTLLMYILALMSKETAIIMPALVFIADFFFQNQNGEFSLKEKIKEGWRTIWPLLTLAVIYILLRATDLNFINTFNLYNEKNVFASNFHIRLFTFFRVLTNYFGLLFWPFELHMERGVELAASFFSSSVILGGFIFLGLLALALKYFKKLPVLSFGILWFFIGLVPTSNILIPINGILYEHWLYLPMIGIFSVLVYLGEILAKKYNLKKVFYFVLAGFLIFMSVLTINRNKDWRDPITFYNQTLKYAPASYRIINNLGMAYAEQSDYEQAEKMYKKAIDLDPSSPVAYHNLGNTYKAIGKTDLAIENFKKALLLDPNFIFSQNALKNL